MTPCTEESIASKACLLFIFPFHLCCGPTTVFFFQRAVIAPQSKRQRLQWQGKDYMEVGVNGVLSFSM